MNSKACSRLPYGMKRRDLYCWPVTVSERSRRTTRITEASSGSHPKSKRSLRMTLCPAPSISSRSISILRSALSSRPARCSSTSGKLAPGECLTAGTERPQETGSLLGASLRWRAEVRHLRSRGIEEHVREIRCRLECSVEACLVADVPVGVFLSGGVDSSAVVSLMSQKLGRRVESVTLSYPDKPDCDELPFARIMADHTGANLHPIIVRPEDAEEAFSECVYYLDEPIADPACINTFIASKHLRAMGVPVALVGEGADELFLGYPSYMRHQRIWPLWRTACLLFAPDSGVAARICRHGSRSCSGLSAHRDLLRRAAQGEGFFLSTDSFFPDGEKAQIVGGPLTELVSTHASASVTEHFAKDGHGLVKEICYRRSAWQRQECAWPNSC